MQCEFCVLCMCARLVLEVGCIRKCLFVYACGYVVERHILLSRFDKCKRTPSTWRWAVYVLNAEKLRVVQLCRCLKS